MSNNVQTAAQLAAEVKSQIASAPVVAPTSKKTPCPVSATMFLAQAKPQSALGLTLGARVFSTGSFGWWGGDKIEVTLADGTKVKCQAQITLTVVNSKEAAR